ncbi:HpcH/HpaI aldolase/citrate lyase family protein [Bacillus massiliglaciei]|uniref:HpcH/HpaI aldolase/citrate lyase family protein n=1 Tax=Bacillus massiliglaciei TaxID=1816693 RepID=UPI000B10A4BF|nr:HpcH/HpaI aldolase/citrate lyase family protein [Bacillus massiliglaciei]
MRHFNYLSEETMEQIFYRRPAEFTKNSEKELLAMSVGACLYMPGTRPNICQDIIQRKHAGLVSMVLCLEDAVSDHEVPKAELNVITQIQEMNLAVEKGEFPESQIPLLFVRVRSREQMERLADQLGSALKRLTGFVFPKFTAGNGRDYLQSLQTLNKKQDLHLYAMPILESEEVMYKESRIPALLSIKELLDEHYDSILNVRMGATDFCGLFGIRRSSDSTIYDISVVRDCIADIVNFFSRSEKEYVISGPVWEYFYKEERVLKPQLRETPFKESFGEGGRQLRQQFLNEYLDGLVKEVLLDKNNGLIGKTIIHPTHIRPVHAFLVVSYEEYMDAVSIIENIGTDTGVLKSRYANKMNEVKPHYHWAVKILRRANIYGVFHEQISYINLLTEPEHVHI